jgi:hypothetical protein
VTEETGVKAVIAVTTAGITVAVAVAVTGETAGILRDKTIKQFLKD